MHIYIYLLPFYWHHGINFNTTLRRNRKRYKTETFLTGSNKQQKKRGSLGTLISAKNANPSEEKSLKTQDKELKICIRHHAYVSYFELSLKFNLLSAPPTLVRGELRKF